jgi:chromate transporter
MTAESPDRPRARVRDLALVFTRLGTTAFGGPAAHIALMEREVVEHRRWLTRETFLDLLGAANLIPGPNSTELAIHVGYDQRGVRGLVVAGACFIAPAMLIVMALGWAYTRYGSVPAVAGVLYGVKPVMIAIVVQALWKLARTAIKSWELGAIGVIAAASTLLGVHELVVLAGAGLLAMAGRAAARASLFAPLVPVAAAAGPAAFSLGALFVFFLKVGAVLYGSGYVLLAFLRADLVERWHWLTESQLLDAIAVGQITPGPVFTTATFVGYQLGGPTAALIATAGIFLPAFVFVAASGPLVRFLRRSPAAGAFLDGVNVASLGLMAVVTVMLATTAIVDVPTVAIAAVATAVLLLDRATPTWLIAAGAAIGVVRVLAA